MDTRANIGLRETIIRAYVSAYNGFDIEKMVEDLDDSIIFENIQNNTVLLRLDGIAAFKEQAKGAASFFMERNQKISLINHRVEFTEVEINYSAILAADLGNLKAGTRIQLKGKSIFQFNDRNKIIAIRDIS